MRKPEINETILAILEDLEPGKTLCPSTVAQALAGNGKWQSLLHDVRVAAIELAVAEELVIYRKGKIADPSDFKGVYRIGAIDKSA
jgi:hypothetical protein